MKDKIIAWVHTIVAITVLLSAFDANHYWAWAAAYFAFTTAWFAWMIVVLLSVNVRNTNGNL
jgi:hypothetical protein